MPYPVLPQKPNLVFAQQITGGFKLVWQSGSAVNLPLITMPQASSDRYLLVIANAISNAYYYGTDFAGQLNNYASTGEDFEIVPLNSSTALRYDTEIDWSDLGHIDPKSFKLADPGSSRHVVENYFGPDFTKRGTHTL